MKNLFTIDLGNSHPHFGLFENGKLQSVSPLINSERLNSRQYKIIASQVASSSFIEQVKDGVKDRMIDLERFWDHKNHCFAGMPVHYAQTIGQDRLVQAAHAFHLFQGQEVMVIDAGTFVTVDLINFDGLSGGFILPGLHLMLESYLAGDALKKYTKEEVIKESILPINDWPGDTKKAVCHGVLDLYRSFYFHKLQKHAPTKLIVTGGDSDLHLQILRDMAELSHHPHFIHESLYFLANLD